MLTFNEIRVYTHKPPPDFVVLSNLDNLYPSISTSAFDTVDTITNLTLPTAMRNYLYVCIKPSQETTINLQSEYTNEMISDMSSRMSM